jgi:hypothetical protein
MVQKESNITGLELSVPSDKPRPVALFSDLLRDSSITIPAKRENFMQI